MGRPILMKLAPEVGLTEIFQKSSKRINWKTLSKVDKFENACTRLRVDGRKRIFS